jgi:hypothetical protein
MSGRKLANISEHRVTYRANSANTKFQAMMSAVSSTILSPSTQTEISRNPSHEVVNTGRENNNRPISRQIVCAVIPAHNEASRISNVLRAVLDSPAVDRVIVVNDGSTDSTSQVVREFVPDVTLIDLPQNRGKGGAMLAGAAAAEGSDILLFLDGDLQNLTPGHVTSLVRPLVENRADMAIGQFRGGRGLTDLAQLLVPYISGQRAIKRDLFLAIPGLSEVGYGIEMAITFNVKRLRGRVRSVTIRGVTHPMKEEKLGLFRGAISRLRMYYQMLKFTIKYFVSKG